MSAHTAKNKRTLRTDIPTDVWERFAAEARAAGVPVGRYLHDLIVRRDIKKHGARPSTGPSNQKEK